MLSSGFSQAVKPQAKRKIADNTPSENIQQKVKNLHPAEGIVVRDHAHARGLLIAAKDLADVIRDHLLQDETVTILTDDLTRRKTAVIVETNSTVVTPPTKRVLLTSLSWMTGAIVA